MSTGCKSSHSGFLDVSRSNGGLSISVSIYITAVTNDDKCDIGNRVPPEKVDKFCYIGDMFSVDGRCDLAVTTRVRSVWRKCREDLPILTGKGFLIKLKSKVYTSRARSCLIYSTETWPMKMEHKVNEHNQMDVWVYLNRKEEECRTERTTGIGTSQSAD